MNRSIALGLAMLAGAALGAAAVNGLHAQGRPPGAFAVIDINEISDPEVFTKQLLPKEEKTLVPFGAQFVVRSENIVGSDGTPPKRFVVIAFNSMQTARAWASSASQMEVNTIRMNSTKSRAFIVDGTIQ